jgi:hypothetical protein
MLTTDIFSSLSLSLSFEQIKGAYKSIQKGCPEINTLAYLLGVSVTKKQEEKKFCNIDTRHLFFSLSLSLSLSLILPPPLLFEQIKVDNGEKGM